MTISPSYIEELKDADYNILIEVRYPMLGLETDGDENV